jgi:hypothetical protein
MNGSKMRGPGSRGGHVIGQTKSGRPRYARKGRGSGLSEASAKKIESHFDREIAAKKAHIAELIRSNPAAAHQTLMKQVVAVHGAPAARKMLEAGLARTMGGSR